MRLGALSRAELGQQLRRGDLALSIAPFTVRIRSNVPQIVAQIAQMYGDFQLAEPTGFFDFQVEVMRARGWRRWIKPLAEFSFDGARSFVPLPAQQCFTMLEWGLNWCVAAHAHQYLLVHAAVLEMNGRALLLPAPPGSGKSTLCAGLVHRGWRLISDELALIDMGSGLVRGMARPVNLKNQSIEVIKAFEPAAELTESVPNTNKGTVALMRPPGWAVDRVREPARPAWIVLPRYSPGAAARFTPIEKALTFMTVAEQSFNYDIHGERGFQALARIVDQCQTLKFEYSALEDAAQQFAALASAEAA